jgi:hypothetical protein
MSNSALLFVVEHLVYVVSLIDVVSSVRLTGFVTDSLRANTKGYE